MAVEFKLPPLGEDVEEGVVVSVLVSEGDTIEEDQSVVEIETDKATLEVPCSQAGRITKVHVSEGDNIKVGDTLISLGDGQAETTEEESKDEGASAEEATDEKDEQQEPSKAGKAAKKDKEKNQEADEKESAADTQDEKQAAEKDESGESEEAQEAESETEDAKDEDTGTKDQKKRQRRKKSRKDERKSKAEPEEPVGEEEQPSEPEKEDDGERDESAAPAQGEQIPAPPSTRRLARELGVDLAEVAEAHPGERLSANHVKAFVRDRMQKKGGDTSPRAGAPSGGLSLPDFEQWGPVDRVPLSTLEKRASQRLVAAWVAPHVTHYDIADIGRLESMRGHFAEVARDDDPKLTVTAFLIKAAVLALRKFPKFNASLDTEANELVLKHYYHIGVAVHTDRGLLVPVLRDCDEKSVVDIAAELEQIAERTRNRKVTLEELRGATFTVTNVGGVGGTSFAPILSWPEVAILGAARAREEAVVHEDGVESRLMLPLCLSFDHRAINGVDAANFVREVVQFLENPDVSLMRQ